MKVEVSKKLNVDVDRVWKSFENFGEIYKFHPLVEKSPLLSKNASGIGAKRRCDFYDGTSVVEVVTHWTEKKRIEVQLSEMSMPMKTAKATIKIVSTSSGATKVSLEMDFVPKFGFLGKIMGALMMRPMMKKMLTLLFVGLEKHIQTGKIVGKNGELLQAA
ncbi:SRPBCC family protein [bacterium]|nr:SRPBCC family protein [bacterium]